MLVRRKVKQPTKALADRAWLQFPRMLIFRRGHADGLAASFEIDLVGLTSSRCSVNATPAQPQFFTSV